MSGGASIYSYLGAVATALYTRAMPYRWAGGNVSRITICIEGLPRFVEIEAGVGKMWFTQYNQAQLDAGNWTDGETASFHPMIDLTQFTTEQVAEQCVVIASCAVAWILESGLGHGPGCVKCPHQLACLSGGKLPWYT